MPILLQWKYDQNEYSYCNNMLSFNTVVALCVQALSKALTEDEMVYLRAQFVLLEPSKDGRVSIENFRMVSILTASLFIFF